MNVLNAVCMQIASKKKSCAQCFRCSMEKTTVCFCQTDMIEVQKDKRQWCVFLLEAGTQSDVPTMITKYVNSNNRKVNDSFLMYFYTYNICSLGENI